MGIVATHSMVGRIWATTDDQLFLNENEARLHQHNLGTANGELELVYEAGACCGRALASDAEPASDEGGTEGGLAATEGRAAGNQQESGGTEGEDDKEGELFQGPFQGSGAPASNGEPKGEGTPDAPAAKPPKKQSSTSKTGGK